MSAGSTTKNVLRWVVCLPGAAIAAWLAWVVVSVIGRWAASGYVDPDGFLMKAYYTLINHGVLGAAFVYFGARIAPSHRKVVAIVLAVIAVLFMALSTYFAFAQENWWAFAACIATAVGSGAVVYSIASGELDLYEK
jgi:hypothetical protein